MINYADDFVILSRGCAAEAKAWITEEGGGATWYVGHHGFQFHAERAGMRPVVPKYPVST